MGDKTSLKDSSDILIIDDDKVMALVNKKKLKQVQFRSTPIICGNGKEALELLHKELADRSELLILLDLNMPVMNGWEFLKVIQGQPFADKLHVVVVSSSAHKDELIEALDHKQVIGFCQKPLNLQNLKEITGLKEVQPFIEPAVKPELKTESGCLVKNQHMYQTPGPISDPAGENASFSQG